MSDSDPPPLDQDLRALVERTSALEAAPAGVRDRVLSRAQLEADAAPPGASEWPDRRVSAVRRRFEGRRVGTVRRSVLAVGFVIVAAAGAAGLHAVLSSEGPAEPSVVAPSVPTPTRPTPRGVDSARPAAAPVLAPLRSAPAARVARGETESDAGSASYPTGSAPGDERALLDEARAALARHDGRRALSLVATHERRFKNGILVQEREALAVRGLVLVGRLREARARTERFRARFPDSVLLPMIQATLEAAEQAPR